MDIDIGESTLSLCLWFIIYGVADEVRSCEEVARRFSLI